MSRNPHTLHLSVEVNVYDTKTVAESIEAVEACIERVDGVKLDTGVRVTFEAPTIKPTFDN